MSKRILVVDDNVAIHEDFKQILNAGSAGKDTEQIRLEDELFHTSSLTIDNEACVSFRYDIDDAYQGEEAIAMVDTAAAQGNPYALLFMDVRMPPGIDGIQTIQKIWEMHPHTEVAICTAHSDYSWDEILKEFGSTDHLLFIQKPFNSVTIKQIALTMTTKWDLDRQNRDHIGTLETRIAERTEKLQLVVKEKEKFIEKIHEEMVLAEIVQQQLLPSKLPQLPSCEIAATYIPVTGIGGDLYDIISLDKTTVAFLIFDVSGHGIAAALVTAIGKIFFRQHLREERLPQKVLELVNRDIFASTPTQIFVTAFLMVYDTETKRACYAGAGHVPQLHYQSEGNTITELFGRGLFLGVERNSTYKVGEVQVGKGDKLLFYTDGLTETCNQEKKLYGRDRLKKILCKNADRSCNEIIQQVMKNNEAFKGEQKRLDDLCILAVDIKAG